MTEVDRRSPGQVQKVELPTTSLEDVARVLQIQSEDPPGNDVYISSCYKTVLQGLNNRDPLVTDVIASTLAVRPHITPQYFVNLLFRAIQYVEIFKPPKSNTYPHTLESEEAWKKELGSLLRIYNEDIKDLLAHKDTSTTIYQRYAGAQAIINASFNGRPLRVADFGCGGNLGLPGMSLGMPFDEIEDFTPQERVTSLLAFPTKIEEGIAIDKEDPHDPEAKKWRMACSFYPSEFGRLAEATVFEERLSEATNVSFHKSDLLSLPVGQAAGERASRQFDAVIMSTVLYQLTPEEQAAVLENAKQLVTAEGVIIVEDFATKSPSFPAGLDFDTRWHGDEWSYRTFVYAGQTDWQPREILQWGSGRCTRVRAGEDFRLLETLRQ